MPNWLVDVNDKETFSIVAIIMKILTLAPSYPYPGFPFSGIFSERCVLALRRHCEHIDAMVPRPYVPRFLAFQPRWKLYASIPCHEQRNGISVFRPSVLQIPRVGGAFWYDRGAYIFCRGHARRLHLEKHYDVIVSFDLLGAGGLAWQLARELGIPSCGWAFGSDVRVPASSSYGRLVIRALENLDLVFYQSAELLEQAARLFGKRAWEMPSDRHVVLPHGIPFPKTLPESRARDAIRRRWDVTDSEVVVLSLGRVTREKGIFELLKSASHIASSDKKIIFIVVGAMPAFDETMVVKEWIESDPTLKRRVRIYPPCNPGDIWNTLRGADIFAFASHKEGMPNSLLEAMAAGLPAVAFAIPSVEELDGATSSLIKVEPFDAERFAVEIMNFAESPEKRKIMGEKGRRRVEEHFHIEKNMARAAEIIQELIDRRIA